MKKTRAEAEHSSNLLGFDNLFADLLENFLVFREHRDVGQESKVITGLEAVNVLADDSAQCVGTVQESIGIGFVGKQLDAVLFENRLFGWKRARLFKLGGQIAGGDFAGFDVRLIERIDAEDGACDRGGDLPLEHGLTEIVKIADHHAENRFARFFERCNKRFDRRFRCRRRT